MPFGKGTYGSKVGRPKTKKNNPHSAPGKGVDGMDPNKKVNPKKL